MGRVHLFEFLDQSWFPSFLRDPMTGYLEAVERLLSLDAFAQKVREVLTETGTTQIVDMGSGSTGPVLHLVSRLQEAGSGSIRVRLTDLYPSQPGIQKVRALGNPDITYEERPVDATHPPDDLTGMRTLFAAFHHFKPELARKVLADAFERRAPIGVFELTVRSLPTVLTAPLIIPTVLLLTPTVRPLRWTQLLLTYVLPILPLLIFWDGFVSHLRAYSTQELRELVKGLEAPDYQWDIGELRVKGIPVGLPYLVGKPVKRTAAA